VGTTEPEAVVQAYVEEAADEMAGLKEGLI